jgi:hypothetical protein
MEDDGILYGQLVHFMVYCFCILWTFGIVRDNLVFSPVFGILTKKVWQPCFPHGHLQTWLLMTFLELQQFFSEALSDESCRRNYFSTSVESPS